MLINDCGWKDGDSGDSAAKNLLTQTGLLMEGVITTLRFLFALQNDFGYIEKTPAGPKSSPTDALSALQFRHL